MDKLPEKEKLKNFILNLQIFLSFIENISDVSGNDFYIGIIHVKILLHTEDTRNKVLSSTEMQKVLNTSQKRPI